MKFEKGQPVRHKYTNRIGVIGHYADPPWDVYVIVKFTDGSSGFHLASEFEKTKIFPKFKHKESTLKIKKHSNK